MSHIELALQVVCSGGGSGGGGGVSSVVGGVAGRLALLLANRVEGFDTTAAFCEGRGGE